MIGHAFDAITEIRVTRPLVGVGCHSVIKLLKEGVICFSAVLLGQADGPGPLDHDLRGVGLGGEDLHGFVDVVVEGHGAGVGALSLPISSVCDVGRDDFENLDGGVLELVAQRLRVGVDGGLGGAVGGRERQGQKARPEETLMMAAWGCF